MSTETVYLFHCDAPLCAVETYGTTRVVDVPDGWTRISSTDHLDDGQTSRTIADWNRFAGDFALHLCPDHPHVFDGHRPSTWGGSPSRDGHAVTIRCSCGTPIPWQRDIRIVGQTPSLATHHAWWSHLPTGLQWYAVRDKAVAA